MAPPDDDEYRRAQAIRKKRAQQFLGNGYAIYTLLNTLVFHHLLTVITRIAFAMVDSDCGDIRKEQLTRRQERKNRRLRFKGAQSFQFEEGPANPRKGYTLQDFFLATHRVIDMLWTSVLSPDSVTKTHFAIPAAFWPQHLPKSDMRQRMSEDMLKTLANLKFRLIYRELSSPYSFLDAVDERGGDEGPASAAAKRLLDSHTCCLDPFFGRPLQADCQSSSDPAQNLQNHMKTFVKNCRPCSHREETMHAQQRQIGGGGFKAKAPLFVRQSAEMVLRTGVTNYERRTAISAKHASAKVKAAARQARTKFKHKRAGQFGNIVFFYVMSLRRQNPELTFSDLHNQWKHLPADQKEMWKRKHIISVAQKRMAQNDAKRNLLDAEQQAQEAKEKSPWKIGDAQYPLSVDHLNEFLAPYRKRDTGLAALALFNTPETKEHLQNIENGRKYHSMDAAVAGARATIGHTVSDKMELMDKIMAAERRPACCMELHPGVCKTADAGIMSAVDSIQRTFPRGSHLLMIERLHVPAKEKFVLYVRSVVGPVFRLSDWFGREMF